MKTRLHYLLIALSLFIISCSDDSDVSHSESLADSAGGGGGGGQGGQGNQSGLITAGEWNDLENWQFWQDLLNGADYADKSAYWGFYPNNRIALQLSSNENPVVNAKLVLLKNGAVVWTSRTDNHGKAEMWVDLFQFNQVDNRSDYSLTVNDQPINTTLKFYEEGVNEITLNNHQNSPNRVELAFIVDATGSMGDELEFLKDDLADVIQSVKNDDATLDIYTSSVFYRDEGDDYLVRKSDFSNNINNTLDFINDQSAAGGGDFPEAVHTALKTGIEELQWSASAKTRLAFLLLDAPPHHHQQIIGEIQHSIKEAAKKGIKIIPITASGIDKETEFLMRFFSISTNSTYVFITNDSGIGNEHLEASVGEYQVEQLNALMVRLIKKYT